MNASIDYIESNLAGNIDIRVAAGKACCSECHFTRIFSYLAGMTLAEYIRRRRLTLAGFNVQRSTEKIIDIAARYGYDSPNSFTRAFQAMHGAAPSEARSIDFRLQFQPRLVFKFDTQADIPLAFRIVEEGPLTVFGKSITVTRACAVEAVGAFWDRCERERVTNQIVKAARGHEKTLLGSVLFDLDDDTLRYMIALPAPKCGVSGEFEIARLPARTWAVFPLVLETPEDHIIAVWQRVFSQWFPTSDYEMDTGPRQERCRWEADGKMTVEAWVPVVKKGSGGTGAGEPAVGIS